MKTVQSDHICVVDMLLTKNGRFTIGKFRYIWLEIYTANVLNFIITLLLLKSVFICYFWNPSFVFICISNAIDYYMPQLLSSDPYQIPQIQQISPSNEKSNVCLQFSIWYPIPRWKIFHPSFAFWCTFLPSLLFQEFLLEVWGWLAWPSAGPYTCL